MSKRLIIHNTWNGWHVHLEGDLSIWDGGGTIEEAIGSFCLTHPDRVPSPLQMVLVEPTPAAMKWAPTLVGKTLNPGHSFQIVGKSPDGLTPANSVCADMHSV